MKRLVMPVASLLGCVASVSACSGHRASQTPAFLPALRGFDGLSVVATKNIAGLTCLTLSLGDSELKTGCQPDKLKPTVFTVGGGNFRMLSDRAPAGTNYVLYALDFDDVVYRFDDLSNSGSVATSGRGYVLALVPGIVDPSNVSWKLWIHNGVGPVLVCVQQNGPLDCSLNE